MSLNVDALSKKIAIAGVTLAQAQTIISSTLNLIDLVEDIYDGLKGKDKRAAVLAGLDTVLEQLNLTEKAQQLKALLEPLISVVVTMFNLKGLWSKLKKAID